MKNKTLLAALSITALLAPALQAAHWWEKLEHWVEGEKAKPGAMAVPHAVAPKPGYTARPKGLPFANRHARRVARWETTIKALKAYGVPEDSETMKWAEKNLQRAHTPSHRVKHWTKARRKAFEKAKAARAKAARTTTPAPKAKKAVKPKIGKAAREMAAHKAKAAHEKMAHAAPK